MATYMLHFNNSIYPGYLNWNVGAIGKAEYDREVFAKEIGVQMMNAFIYDWPDEPWETLGVRFDGMLAGLKTNDILIAQWEIAINHADWVQHLIDSTRQFGAKIVFVVEDINSWRMGSGLPLDATHEDYEKYKDWPEIKHEAHFLGQADGLILASRAMEDRLRKQVAVAGLEMTKNVTYYGPSGQEVTYFAEHRKNNQGVDYAGSLHKAPWLLNLPEDFKINVIGANEDDKDLLKYDNITLHDKVDSEIVPQTLKGSYGLVWDSESYPDVTGSFGDYQRYNTPAKFTTYLSADEPVIIWDQSPHARFVEENKIGIVISTLDELPAKIAAIDDDAYWEMADNVLRISPLIRSGYFFKQAIFDLEGMLTNFGPQYHNWQRD